MSRIRDTSAWNSIFSGSTNASADNGAASDVTAASSARANPG
jgi:hypothetical protein